MELSYDKYERRFWLSLDVPLWLDRLLHPYQDCVEDAVMHPSAQEEALRDLMEQATSRMARYSFTDPRPRSNGTTYTMTRYKDFPNLPLPMDQE